MPQHNQSGYTIERNVLSFDISGCKLSISAIGKIFCHIVSSYTLLNLTLLALS